MSRDRHTGVECNMWFIMKPCQCELIPSPLFRKEGRGDKFKSSSYIAYMKERGSKGVQEEEEEEEERAL